MRRISSFCILTTVILLVACTSMSKQEFLQDRQNVEKSKEIANVFVSTGCEKIIELNNFIKLESPTNNDLAKIMPVFGLDEHDVTNVDKIYKIDWSVLENYSCASVRDLKINYCLEKYGAFLDLFKENRCLASVNDRVPPFDTYQKHGQYTGEVINFVYDGKDIAGLVKNKIQKMYKIPEEKEYLLTLFTPGELVTAEREVLGTYDGNCNYSEAYLYLGMVRCESRNSWIKAVLCDYKTNKVTRLDAIELLNTFCLYKTTFMGANSDEEDTCMCFAHETYKKVDYKNLLYIFEKGNLPQSKQAEFNQILKECEQKIKRQRGKTEQERYGE